MSTTSTPDAGPQARSWMQPLAAAALFAAAVALLPVSAVLVEALVGDAGTVISLLHLVLATAAGAAVGGGVSSLGPGGAAQQRRAVVWGGVGLGAAVVAQLAWYLLLG